VFWCKAVVHRDDEARQALGELSVEGVLGVYITTAKTSSVEV